MASDTPHDDDDLAAAWAASAQGQALGQDQIDNLFDDGRQAQVRTSKPLSGLDALVGGAVVRYERLPVLNIVVDRLARLLTSGIRKFTADNADVSIEKTKPVRLGAFLDAVSNPAMIAVIRIDQWDGYCLAALDPKLIGSVVDILLGGRRNGVQPIEGRPYTMIETTLVQNLVDDVVTPNLKRAFEAVCEVDFALERCETTPNYAAITKMSAAAVSFRAEVFLEGDRGGHIDFLIPYAVLEPVRDALSQDFVGKRQGGDTIWRSHLLEEIPRATVQLRAVIDQRAVFFADVLKWRPGTVIVLDRRSDDPIDLYCEDLLVSRARIAEQNGSVVLQVEERRIVDVWPEQA